MTIKGEGGNMTKEEGQKAYTEVWHMMRDFDASTDYGSDEWWERLVKKADSMTEGLEKFSQLEMLRRNLTVGLLNYYAEQWRRSNQQEVKPDDL